MPPTLDPRQPDDASPWEEDQPTEGQVWLVTSAKGGVGKSLVASHLALGLAMQPGHRTLLVDANVHFGDQAMLLNLNPRFGLEQLVERTVVDPELGEELLTAHPSGLALVASPPDPVQGDAISPALVTRLVQQYRSRFDSIVVDTHTGLDELNLQLLEEADRILLVTTPELASTIHTSQFIAVARTLGYDPRIKVVLNRANAGLNVDRIEESLGRPVAHQIVSAGPAVVRAANLGFSQFVSDPYAQDRITQDLQRLVEAVAGQPVFGVGAGQIEPASSPSQTRNLVDQPAFRGVRQAAVAFTGLISVR
jgi:pilus assembly protein CpaE